MQPSSLFQKLENNKIKCLTCNHYCVISENNVGVCSVRANINGKLELLVDNKTTGLSVDPIEKKPFYHFLPQSKALSFGTFGCNFGCIFCQNWELSQGPKILKEQSKNRVVSANELFPLEISFPRRPESDHSPDSGFDLTSFDLPRMTKMFIDQNSNHMTPKEIVQTALESNCLSIAYTYNEPTVFTEYAFKTMKLAKNEGLKNMWVSNGYESKECFELIKNYLDAINIDLKGANNEFYLKYCKAKLAPVLENIKKFHNAGVWVEITTMLIEGVNDSETDLRFIARFIKSINKGIPWHLSQMHPDYKMTERDVTPYASLERAYQIGKKEGLKYIYCYSTGQNTEKNNSYCPKCNALLIERNYFDSNITNLKNGRCSKCHEKIEGVWN